MFLPYLVDVLLAQVFKVQLFGQIDDAGAGSDVEGAGALAVVGLQGVPDVTVGERLGLDRDDVGVFALGLWDLSLVRRHVKLRRPFPSHDRQAFLRGGLVLPALSAVLVFRLDVKDVLHVQLEGFLASCPDYT